MTCEYDLITGDSDPLTVFGASFTEEDKQYVADMLGIHGDSVPYDSTPDGNTTSDDDHVPICVFYPELVSHAIRQQLYIGSTKVHPFWMCFT